MLKDIQLKFFCLLIGEKYSQVQNYQYSSKRKITLMGSSLLIPVITWVAFTTAISVNIYKEPLIFSIVLGFFAGFIVLLIERSIVLAKPKEKFSNWLILVFRIFLGLAIAYISASFIDQIIFKDDIDSQVSVLRNKKLDKIEENVKNKYKQEVSDLDFANKQAFNDWQISLNGVATEADGTGGGKMRGAGVVARLKQSISVEKERVYESTAKKLEYVLVKRNAEIQAKKSSSIFLETAFLTRIQALNTLLSESNDMRVYYWVVTAFFIMMEFLVVILKFSSKQSIDEFLEEKRELLERERINKLTTNNLNLVTSSYQNTHIENSKKKMGLLQVLN